MKIKISELTDLTLKALKNYGYTDEESKIISDVLLYAQLRGNNQGVVKLIGKGIPKSPDAGEIKIIKETKLSALLDGNLSHSMVVLKKAIDMVVQKAKEHGFGIVGSNHTNTSSGAMGYYANKIAQQGLIGFAFASGPETVAPFCSYEPVYCTNPLAIGVPSEGDPIVVDMATSAMAYYGLIEAKTAGKKIPPDIAYDKDGNLTDDPGKAMDGALRPFDKGQKSSGLAFMVEVFAGPLVAAAFAGGGDLKTNDGNLLMALDPGLLTDPEEFKRNVSALGRRVKSAKKLPGVSEILLPGERGNRLTKERMTSGEIDIEDNLYNELKKVAGI
ncbi:Ldh family oxidoreductase [Candidatus Gottesmanbacteria bacterium]|nr:Ldh family oxidoreductase [Candidatus Gottesmanbacteria bacterium]